jgi:hypothetical protein
MKRNCLFTVNIKPGTGNFITTYVRDHTLHACQRWGCDYTEIHDYLIPGYSSCSKYLGPERLSGYHKIMMLDGDCLISKHAPNPFDLLQEENVMLGVSDYLQAPNHCQTWLDNPYRLGMAAPLARNPNLKVPSPEQFINGGFWLCVNNDTCRRVFELAKTLLPQHWMLHAGLQRELAYEEMGCTNLAIHNTPPMKLCLLPETWNHMIPQGCDIVPEYYINHFGGWAQKLLKEKSFEYERARFTGQ